MRVLVTGASRDIGRATALCLAGDHDVAVGYNESSKAGPVETDMNDEILAYLESVEFRGHGNVDTHLLQYACEPETVAHSVEYLLENDDIRGEVLNVNGGMQFR